MRSGVVIITKVGLQNSAQMIVIDHNQVIEAFPADAADHPLYITILPGSPRRCPYLLDAHSVDSVCKALAVDSVTVSEEKSRRTDFGKRLHDLLCCPDCRGVFGNVEVQDAAAVMGQNYENVEHAQPNRRNREEIYGNHLADMILQKRHPRLRRIPAPLWHQSRNGAFGNLKVKLQQFSVDARRSPQGIRNGHGFDQLSDLRTHAGSSGTAGLRQLQPVLFEPLALPCDYRFGPNNHESRLPIRPNLLEPDPEQSVSSAQPWPFHVPLENGQLLTQCRILQYDVLMATDCE